MTTTDMDGARIGGFLLTKVVSKQGKGEDSTGSLEITLRAEKEEINTGSFNMGDFLASMNTHQEGQQPVVLRVLMPTNVVER